MTNLINLIHTNWAWLVLRAALGWVGLEISQLMEVGLD